MQQCIEVWLVDTGWGGGLSERALQFNHSLSHPLHLSDKIKTSFQLQSITDDMAQFMCRSTRAEPVVIAELASISSGPQTQA